jgi:hypothetical protein
LNYIIRKNKKPWVRKPFFMLEKISENKFIVQRGSEKMVLKIGEPKKYLVKHQNLKTPKLEGSDGIIVDLETKICQQKVSY